MTVMTTPPKGLGTYHLECDVAYWNIDLQQMGIESTVFARMVIDLRQVESFGERVYNGEKDGTLVVEMRSGSTHNVQLSLDEFKDAMFQAAIIQ